MADRFWVGGSGNWSSTTKWSTTSGGGTGASVPTSADDAIFDANSGGKFTATVDTAQSVNSLRITPSAGAGLLQIALTASLTTGNLTTTGTAGNNRIFFTSTTYGLAVDFIVNGTVSISDCDFRGVYVRGTSAPISGTRIGNRGECRNITFSTPKTVYWNLAGAQNWSANGWATTSTGTPSTDNFPLPQDTATFTNAGSVTGTISLNNAILYVPNVDMSGRTSAMTLALSNSTTVYGNWTNGSGTTITLVSALTFSGGGTQTITSAGKTFGSITVDTYGGTVQLADALSIGTQTLTVTNGTFSTQGYSVTASAISSSNTNVRTISLGASTISLSTATGLGFTTVTNLTFNAGTSQINLTYSLSGSATANLGGLTYNNVTFTNTTASLLTLNIGGQNTFNNLTLVCTAASDYIQFFTFAVQQTVTGTLTCAGSSAVQRIFLQSTSIGTSRTLSVGTLSATDCDFQDINLTGAASGSAPTRAGNCGGNSGLSFSTKTVYWNLGGALQQSWASVTTPGWASSSGGTPAVNNFPLAQDTAIFDNTGAMPSGSNAVAVSRAFNLGTLDASTRTSAGNLQFTNGPFVYNDLKLGTGISITVTGSGASLTFAGSATQTITSNGVQFGCDVTVNHPSANVQLADALSLHPLCTLILTSGTFNAVTYNVTAGAFSNGSVNNTLRMGSGTWTMSLSGGGTVWACTAAPVLIAGTSTIVLSDTSTNARTFDGGGLYYNKLTIGGATGISTTTITGNNTFAEIASTKTVAHTIAFGTTVQTFGKWSVTGTVGNVVTVTGTSTTNVIAGPRVSGVDYLAMGTIGFSTTSPGEFYAGANSTGTGAGVILTAAPAARTLYWRGGTGNWSDTTKWDTVSGGTGPAAIPTSADAVNFNSASNATLYTATIDAGVTIARCASFTMAGPASGNVTFAGTVPIAFHGNVSFAATGITRTYTGAMSWAGGSSYTFNTNGLTLASACTVIGVGSTWTLGFDLSTSSMTVTYGTFSTSASNYTFTSGGTFSSSNSNVRSISLNNSTLNLSAVSTTAVTLTNTANLTWNAGNSQINLSANSSGISSGGLTFYNVSFTGVTVSSIAITGVNIFNNLSFAGRTSVGIAPVTFSAAQTINGTLTVSAGTASAYRTFLASNTLGTSRALSCGAVSLTDVDFRDIAITGVTASGTRLGDCQGNSGISFPGTKTVYWAVAGGGNWGATGAGSWSATSGGAAANDQFPLPQDTAYIPFATPNDNTTITVNANYNIGTIDMNQRNGSARVTLATGATAPTIYGNWINGTGTTLSGTGTITFAGRTTQQITSAAVPFTQVFSINTPGGSVTLQDALTLSQSSASAFILNAGTFNAAIYNATFSGALSGVSVSATNIRTIAFGSGTWTIAGSTGWSAFTPTNLTITGTGTISLTSASTKTFTGGNLSYSGITLNQGGAGALTIAGNNTFKTITNTYSATGATSIALGNTTQTLTNPWTATGAVGNILTISGTSAAAPGTLVYTGAGTAANVDYLSISNVRAYPLTTSWYAGTNSTNGGSLGWYFVAAGGAVYAVTITETGTGSDSILAQAVFKGTISETGTGTDTVVARLSYLGTISELATGTDAISAAMRYARSISETGTASDTISAQSSLGGQILESATIADTDLARLIARATISETATGTDLVSARATFRAAVAESATITDLISAIKGYVAAIVESATGSDTVSARYITRPTISESAAATDIVRAFFTAAARISELATGTDAVSALQRMAAAVAESATATDSVLAKVGFLSRIQEAAAAQDAVNAPGSIYKVLLQELATAQDAITARATFRSSVTETATGTETDRAAFIPRATITESATITDAASAVQRFAARILETSAASDVVRVAPSVFNAIAVAAATAIDNFNPAGSVYNARIPESATLSDSVIGAYLWNDINDGQTPNWVDVNDALVASWTQIQNDQTPGWNTINDSETGSWIDIDDSQTPGWQNINNL